jgi:hypothetical protein
LCIVPAFESEARRHAHLAGRRSYLLRAVLKELDDTRRRLADAMCGLDTAQAHALEQERRVSLAALGGQA